jgi:hypothetical protein
LENYESDSSVEADEDTDAEAGADPAVGATKSQHRTRSTVERKSTSAVAAAISAVKATKQKKKRKRRVASPSAVATPTILMPHSWEVRSEDEEEEEEEEKEKDEAVEEFSVPERPGSKKAGESYCQEAAGAGAEDAGGSSLAWFGSAAQCCSGTGEDTCGY